MVIGAGAVVAAGSLVDFSEAVRRVTPVCACTLRDAYGQPVPNPTCPVHSHRRRTLSGPLTAAIAVAVLGAIAGGLYLHNRGQELKTGDCLAAGAITVLVVPCGTGTLRILAVRQGVGIAVQDDCRSELAAGSATYCLQPLR